MWKQPWGYAEGWAISIGLFITGVILQMTTGKVDATLFRYPLNAIAGGVFLFFLIMVYAASRKAAVLQSDGEYYVFDGLDGFGYHHGTDPTSGSLCNGYSRRTTVRVRFHANDGLVAFYAAVPLFSLRIGVGDDSEDKLF